MQRKEEMRRLREKGESHLDLSALAKLREIMKYLRIFLKSALRLFSLANLADLKALLYRREGRGAAVLIRA